MRVRTDIMNAFNMSYKATVRHLRFFGVPVIINQKRVDINMEELKQYHPRLYYSIAMVRAKRVKKAFFYVSDLVPIFGKHRATVWRWVIKNKIPTTKCGNKLVILAFDILKLAEKARR